MFKPIGLGDRVKDPISGFEGIVNCVLTYLNGCIRCGVRPESVDKEGKPKDEQYFDQSQLQTVKPGVLKPLTMTAVEAPVQREQARTPGGPERESPGVSPAKPHSTSPNGRR
jgi:hypothetical protein